VFRSDESGTTDNFQKYLDAASGGAWGKGPGVLHGRRRRRCQGQRRHVCGHQEHGGSITYNEWSLQVQGLASPRSSRRQDRAGRAHGRDRRKAIDGVKIEGDGNDLVLDTASF